ncbi:transposase [Listeria monocytogenes]|uniref:helix-turn-helix domain-containing protein n=1 Tax=Listeria monocytogenes TaxID=1639 RepID=UPI000984E91D|nr:transposase [Listeria monocytogenes]MCD1877337.1 transposase [Listeria monocytogenes]MCD1921135.1 transposase [Listeria monocytogenes]MCD2012782.1 transposase [Listeria monocytogenes]MDA5822095.1 transposase [Listeria monocytogenes]MDA5886506.1 transposase [Listeria monocytogenes]
MAKAKYEENFKKSLVALYSRGKTKHSICQEFNVPHSTFGKWIKKFNNEENIESNEILNILQAQELKKQRVLLEEELSILTEAIAVFENPLPENK